MRVPVLSNTIRFTLPATLTLGGDIQKILFFLSLLIANAVPAVMAAGSAGGTVIVIRSSDLSIIAEVSYPYLIIIGSVQKNPKIAIHPIANINFNESS